MDLLEQLTPWQWWILALGLLVIQILRPGSPNFVAASIGAGVSGLVLALAPQLVWQWQVIIFAVVALGTLSVGKIYVKRHPLLHDEPYRRNSAEKLLDRIFTLSEPIRNGLGKLRVDDLTYTIEGDDMPGGSQVRIVGFGSAALLVSKVS